MPAHSISAAPLRAFVAAYLSLIALTTVAFALRGARAAHPWILADWLINDSAGLVRRGLPGQLILLLHRSTDLPLLGLASALQLAAYALFVLSLIPLLRTGLRWSFPLLAALVSPATLAFPVLDPPNSLRKEMLLYLALSLTCNAVAFFRPKPSTLAAALSLVAPALVLSHEGLAVFLPYLFAPLFLREARRPARAAMLAFAPILLTAGALAGVLARLPTAAQAAAICTSIGGGPDTGPPSLCSGSVAYLARTPAEAREDTRRAVRHYTYATRFPLPVLLALLPAALLLRRRLQHASVQHAPASRETRRPAQIVLAAGTLALLASVPLFVVARDWGRWISIHATCLLLLSLLLERQRANQPASQTAAQPAIQSNAQPLEEGLQLPASPRLRSAALLALALYATAWTLPAVGIFPGRFGYVDLVRYLQSYRTRPHLTTAGDSLGTP